LIGQKILTHFGIELGYPFEQADPVSIRRPLHHKVRIQYVGLGVVGQWRTIQAQNGAACLLHNGLRGSSIPL
jgi:hypothetical protein